ncbi:MAG: flagellar hook-length control protein FliK [Noviherbaspirillum sp.]
MTMKTSAITNPLATAGNSASAKTGALSDMPFDQVLSREVSNRSNASELNAPGAKGGKTAAQAPQTAQTTPSPSKSNEASSAEEGKTVSSAEDTSTAVGEGKIATGTNDAQEEDETALDAASAELLALVASLNQAITAQAKPSDDARAGDEAALVSEMIAVGQSAEVTVANDAAQFIAAQQTDTSEPAVATSTVDVATTAATSLPRADAAPAGLASPSIDATRTVGADRGSAKLGARASSATDTSSPTESTDVGATLAQAKGGMPALESGAAKPQPAPIDLAAAAPELRTSAMAQDTPTAAAPINIAALSPTQQQVQTAVGVAANNLTPHVGNPGWDQALGQKVVWMVSNAQQSASLTLNPPDLGPLQVVLNISNSHATANFTAAQPEVRQALESAMPKLREMLGEAGIQLGQANVSAGTPNGQQGAYAQREPERQPSRGAGQVSDSADTPAQVSRSQVVTGGQGLVDTFV